MPQCNVPVYTPPPPPPPRTYAQMAGERGNLFAPKNGQNFTSNQGAWTPVTAGNSQSHGNAGNQGGFKGGNESSGGKGQPQSANISQGGRPMSPRGGNVSPRGKGNQSGRGRGQRRD